LLINKIDQADSAVTTSKVVLVLDVLTHKRDTRYIDVNEKEQILHHKKNDEEEKE